MRYKNPTADLPMTLDIPLEIDGTAYILPQTNTNNNTHVEVPDEVLSAVEEPGGEDGYGEDFEVCIPVCIVFRCFCACRADGSIGRSTKRILRRRNRKLVMFLLLHLW